MVKTPVAIAFWGCLIILPYASYIALVGLLGITIWSLYRDGGTAWKLLTNSGWLILAAGMLLTVTTAAYPLESLLQLANFIPFFIFFAAIATLISGLKAPFLVLEQWATATVVTAIPISFRAAVEYYLRFPAIEARLINSPYFTWLYGQPDYGHRADSVFGHPNVLACYLVMLLGLGLGLSLKHLRYPIPNPSRSWWQRSSSWVYLSTVLLLVGVYCSGSRNGALVAIIQLVIFGWMMRRSRFVMIAGLSGILAIFAGTWAWGIGGRSLGEAFGTIDLRLGVWQLAVDTMRQHPWVGAGLGSYKLLYVPYTISDYESVEHAHNLWLMLGAEVGIPLMLGLTVVVGWTCFRGVRRMITGGFSGPQRSLLLSYCLGFLGCTLYALFDITFYDSRVNVLGWVLLATIQAIPSLPSEVPAVGLNQPRSA